MKKPKPALRVLTQHEYISVIHANWRFTMSFGGERGAGVLARNNIGMKALTDYVSSERKAGKKNGDIMNALAAEKVISAVWPAWNAPLVLSDIKVGDSVRAKPEARYIVKRYPGVYEVKKVSKKYAFILLPSGSQLGVELLDLEKVPATATTAPVA